MSNLLIIRIENHFYNNQSWDSTHLQQHRRCLNALIDEGFEIILVSSLSVEMLLEVKKNLYLSNTGYLIGLNGGQVYDVANKKVIYDCYFNTKDLPMLSNLITRIDFDSMSKDLVIVHKKGDNLSYLNNGSCSYEKIKSKYEESKMLFQNIDEIPTNVDIINKVSISFEDDKADATKVVNLLNKLCNIFQFIVLSNKIIEILPYNATISNAFDVIKNNNKSFLKKYNKDNTFTIGLEENDIQAFDQSNFNITCEEAPSILKSKSQAVYLGSKESLILFGVEEIKKHLNKKSQ